MKVNPTAPNSKPPYLLGLLGFIPLVGFFVGIALVLFGLIKYKSRALVVIGAACMLFTVTLYSALYYIGFVSDFGKEGWEKHAQMQLNGLVKHIEYYKIENGNYPDSLIQIVNKDEFVSIYDPTQQTEKKEGRYYNYKKIGAHYVLFSSGTDRIPNTKDDIFPQIKNLKKVGWVSKE